MANHISSRKNELVKEIAGLVRSVENRRAQGLFVVEGARLCYDAQQYYGAAAVFHPKSGGEIS